MMRLTKARMSLSTPLTGCGAEVICHGYIVRTIKSPAPGELPLLAAAILDYRFLRR